MNSIEIEEEDLNAAVAAFAPDTPVFVANLIRYRQRAEYPEGVDAGDVTGEDAYFQRYLPAFSANVARFGGCELAFGGKVVAQLVGAEDVPWDAIIIGRYVSMSAFRDLVNDPTYRRDAKPHRTAALSHCVAYALEGIS